MRCRAKHIATLGFLRLERMIAARSATALLNMRRAQGHIESIVGANKVKVGQVSQMRNAARDHCLEYGYNLAATRLHDDISVASTLNQGTCFTVRFPGTAQQQQG
jgi:hypothetical protein